MLKIRLQRIGRRNNPSYRVVVIDSTAPARKGIPVELLGTHDTVRKTTTLKDERIRYWIEQGAQVSGTMHNILIRNGVIEGVKINVLPKKKSITKKSGEKDAQQKEEVKNEQQEDNKDENSTEENKEEGATPPTNEEKENANKKPTPQDTPSTEG